MKAMNRYKLRCFAMLVALQGSAFGQLTSQPETVRIEGLEQVLALLQKIDRGINRLAQSQWEYRTLQRNRLGSSRLGENVKQQIQAMGRDGWELVGVTVEEGFIFKRRITP